MLRVALVCAPLIVLASYVFQDQIKNSPAGLPPGADTDSQLTEELRLLEQQLGEAAMHMDTKALERLVGAEYTLRIGDAPEESIPRAPWMDSLRPENPHPYKMESFHEQYHAARRLTDMTRQLQVSESNARKISVLRLTSETFPLVQPFHSPA